MVESPRIGPARPRPGAPPQRRPGIRSAAAGLAGPQQRCASTTLPRGSQAAWSFTLESRDNWPSIAAAAPVSAACGSMVSAVGTAPTGAPRFVAPISDHGHVASAAFEALTGGAPTSEATSAVERQSNAARCKSCSETRSSLQTPGPSPKTDGRAGRRHPPTQLQQLDAEGSKTAWPEQAASAWTQLRVSPSRSSRR